MREVNKFSLYNGGRISVLHHPFYSLYRRIIMFQQAVADAKNEYQVAFDKLSPLLQQRVNHYADEGKGLDRLKHLGEMLEAYGKPVSIDNTNFPIFRKKNFHDFDETLSKRGWGYKAILDEYQAPLLCLKQLFQMELDGKPSFRKNVKRKDLEKCMEEVKRCLVYIEVIQDMDKVIEDEKRPKWEREQKEAPLEDSKDPRLVRITKLMTECLTHALQSLQDKNPVFPIIRLNTKIENVAGRAVEAFMKRCASEANFAGHADDYCNAKQFADFLDTATQKYGALYGDLIITPKQANDIAKTVMKESHAQLGQLKYQSADAAFQHISSILNDSYRIRLAIWEQDSVLAKTYAQICDLKGVDWSTTNGIITAIPRKEMPKGVKDWRSHGLAWAVPYSQGEMFKLFSAKGEKALTKVIEDECRSGIHPLHLRR